MTHPPYPPPPPAYGYAPVPPDPRRALHPHPEPRAFDEMLRTWDYAWWRCLVGVLVLLAGVMIVAPLVLMPVLAVAVSLESHDDFMEAFFDAASAKVVSPASMLYLNLVLASAILVTWFVVRVLHNLRPRWLSSVQPRIRWRFLGACLLVSVAAVGAQLVLSSLLPADTSEPMGDPNPITGKLVALGLVILITTPLQATGEEYAFRGYMQQAAGSAAGGEADRGRVRVRSVALRVAVVMVVGAVLAVAVDLQDVHWLWRFLLFLAGAAFAVVLFLLVRPLVQGRSGRHRALVVHCYAIFLPAILFALAHGAQNWPLFLDRLLFGIAAACVALRVGGLEAGIALHVLNNLVAFGIPLFFADIDSVLEVTEVSWWQLPLSLVQNAVFIVLALLVARKMGLATKTSPPVLVDATPYR